jgi:hypothetical protein
MGILYPTDRGGPTAASLGTETGGVRRCFTDMILASHDCYQLLNHCIGIKIIIAVCLSSLMD